MTRKLTIQEVRALLWEWRLWARRDQLPPAGAWRAWLLLGGRGSGKTRGGAEWVRALAMHAWDEERTPRRIALVAPTFDEARLVMIEGPSGLLAIHPDGERPKFEPSKRLLTWPNGSIAHVFSAEEPDGLRGPQFDAAWCDELAKWKQAESVWQMLNFALRLGENPVAVVTTTPRPIAIVKKLLADEATVVSRSKTADNAAFLARPFLKDVTARYAGTRLGRQELDGELIEDDPDALFRRDDIERLRMNAAPELKRVIAAVDPPASFNARSNACGIVVAGLGLDGHAYVLADLSVERARPAQWARKVVSAYENYNASRVVAEVNQGGAMVEQVLREVEPGIAYRAVHASAGKRARAEPVAALYEQGRVHHVGALPALEDEMCSMIEDGRSPDRLDALVWAVTELMLRKQAEPRARVV
ncbi:DNA-packaging protein [Aestuariivirga litoralis]|nr:terminase family protein [Aestuariivirga litoralis]MBG1232232.1 DNA-packaging protein [Aestuariivirga litoralis]